MGECVPLLPPTQAGPLIGPASCGHLRPGLTQGQVPVLHRHGREHPGLSNRKANTALQRAKDLCKHFSKEATQRLASPRNDARRRAKPQGEHPQGGNGNPNRRAGFAQGCGDVEALYLAGGDAEWVRRCGKISGSSSDRTHRTGGGEEWGLPLGHPI